MNIDAKTISKILANQITQSIDRITYHEQVGFIQVCKSVQHLKINKCNPSHQQTKKEKSVIISINAQNMFDKSIHDANFQ